MIFDTKEVKKEIFGDNPIDFGFGNIKKVHSISINTRRLANLKGLIGDLPNEGEFFFIEQINYFNGLSFIQLLLEQFGQIDELMVTTYNMNASGIQFFRQNTRIGKTTILLNEQFKCEEHRFFPLISKRSSRFEFHFTKNHKKVILARIGDKMFGMEGSANVTGVAKNEQCIIYRHEIIFLFRRSEIEKQIEDLRK